MEEKIKKRLEELEQEEKKAIAQLNAIFGAKQELINLLGGDDDADNSEQ